MTTKQNAIELAELIIRYDVERANAASLAADGNRAAANEAEERADALYDEILDLAREVVTKANREANNVNVHVKAAREGKRDEMRAWAALTRLHNAESEKHRLAVERYSDRVSSYQRHLRSITAAIKGAIRAETSLLMPLEEGLIYEMRDAYLSGNVALPVTNADVWEYYDILAEELLTA